MKTSLAVFLAASTTPPLRGIIRKAASLVLVAIPAVVISSCSSPEVSLLTRPLVEGPVLGALLNPDKLSPGTRDYLKEKDLYGVYRKDPAEAIASLCKQLTSNSSHAELIATIELCSDTGDRFAAQETTKGLGYHLTAAELAFPGAFGPAGGSSPSSAQRELVAAYNHSAGQVARTLFDADSSWDEVVVCQGPVKTYRFRCRTRGEGFMNPGFFDKLVPASYLKFKKIDLARNTRAGAGAAMVGHRITTPERRKANPFLPPVGMSLPVNALLDFSKGGGAVELALRDLMLVDHVRLAGRSRPLAADFTAPLAILYNYEIEHNTGWKGLRKPDDYIERMGLYELEPYRPDQIPVVFVHGLMSSPETWLMALNTLRSDPVLRDRYQLLAFEYSTGLPIVYNAAALRKRLREYRNHYDPRRRNAGMANMVMVGHSMGGVISDSLIRDSGDSFTRRMFTRPIDELGGLSEEQKATFKELLVYEANPDVTRAIFAAAPHRGSTLAGGSLGSFAAKLIKFPIEVLTAEPLPDIEGLTELGELVLTERPDSIYDLMPDSPGLVAILEQPVRKGVTYHSIIGHKDLRVPLEESSDGVVPYRSSHLEGAASEKIVHHDHGVTGNLEAIEEVRRILYLHVGLRP